MARAVEGVARGQWEPCPVVFSEEGQLLGGLVCSLQVKHSDYSELACTKEIFGHSLSPVS